MLDLQLLAALTPQFVRAGHRVFQVHRFARTESAHCERLLHWADVPMASRIIDLGSGVGAMAAYWMAARPDLSFFLVNISQEQLAYTAIPSYCGDYTSVPQPDASFDVATFCFSIGHEDYDMALREAFRLLTPGGILFIYDMVRTEGDNEEMQGVSYAVWPRAIMDEALAQAGFILDAYIEPVDQGTYGHDVLGSDYHRIFHGTIPAIWRAIKL